jgi:ribose 1,5-bisphosphokinase
MRAPLAAGPSNDRAGVTYWEHRPKSRRRSRGEVVAAPIVYVMGPSGAGKDTLLRYARERLAGAPIAFAHRYITRPPTAGDENHVALSDAEFRVRLAHGLFAMSWEAHRLHYGIGCEIEAWRRAGLVVVVSGSRKHFEAALMQAPDVIPVVVTCAPDILARRLAKRGRESEEAIAERLRRNPVPTLAHPALVTLDNSGPVEVAGDRFVAMLRQATKSGK